MRRSVLVLAVRGVLAAPLAAAAPASASVAPGPWEPAPSSSWSYPAGVRCGVAVHGGPVVVEAVRRTLAAYGDGTRVIEYKGTLVVRAAHSETGASYDADASGRAVVVIRADRSQTWYVTGPILAGFGGGGGNTARPVHRGRHVHTGGLAHRVRHPGPAARLGRAAARQDGLSTGKGRDPAAPASTRSARPRDR